MAKLTKAQIAERDAARAKLREMLKPGDTVYTILRHTSRSGMRRCISVVLGDLYGPYDATSLVAQATGLPLDRTWHGIAMGGCGMDMGFALVYTLGHALWPSGYGCTGEGCASNDHRNGDRDYTPHGLTDADGTPEDRDPGPGEAQDGLRRHWHADGGYALRREWL